MAISLLFIIKKKIEKFLYGGNLTKMTEITWTTEKEFINPNTELEWKTEGVQPPGLSEAIFYKDEKTGTYIRLCYSKPGVGIGLTEPFAHDFDEFVYIISGGLVNERLGHRYQAGSFAVFPAGTKHGPLSSPVGSRAIEFRHYLSDKAKAKREKTITKEVEFHDVSTLKWNPTVQPPGAEEALAYYEEDSGSYIRFVRNQPGFGEGKEIKTDFGQGACCKHDFDEVIYIVSGGLLNKRLDSRYEAGSIGLMPCGIAHGPMEAPVGNFVIEFRHVIKK